MGGSADKPRGLSAAELAAAAPELQALAGATVLDVTPLAVTVAAEDLLLVLQASDGGKHFVHIALGGPRARVATTARRFDKARFARHQTRDLLRRELDNATLTGFTAAAGERRGEFSFTTSDDTRTLVIELFGARGLWALLDAERRVLALSRKVQTAVRTLQTGDTYVAPPAGAAPRHDTPRFTHPALAAIDAHFSTADQLAEVTREHEILQRAVARALTRSRHKADGMQQQLAASERTDELRNRADLMLAYAHTVTRGATRMSAPDPETGEPILIELDPRRPVTDQARALYDKARRLTDGRAVTTARLAAAEAEANELERVAAAIDAIDPAQDDADLGLQPCRAELERLRALPPTPERKTTTPRARAAPPGESFRRFVSAEGYQILVGRNNAQNDRLTMRFANGNDLWLHVGGGRPGSHVVIRLPKQKTASLETLLDYYRNISVIRPLA